MSLQKVNWLKGVSIIGLVLGLLLLVQGILNYLHVRHLVLDHLEGEAAKFITELETLAWRENPADGQGLSRLLDSIQNREDGAVLWIKVYSQTGEVLAKSTDADPGKLDQGVLESMLEDRVRVVTRMRDQRLGSVLVTTLPFRYRLVNGRTFPEEGPGRLGRPRFNLAELALPLSGNAGPFQPLQHNLAISIAAAVALGLQEVLVAPFLVYCLAPCMKRAKSSWIREIDWFFILTVWLKRPTPRKLSLVRRDSREFSRKKLRARWKPCRGRFSVRCVSSLTWRFSPMT